MLVTGFSESILGFLSKLSEGTSIYRVIEGFLILVLLIIMLLASMVLNASQALIALGAISIYGSYHLRRCRNLYQSYLWGIEGAGYRIDNRSLYRGVIGSIICVEILMIVGGIIAMVSPIFSLSGIASIIAIVVIISFAIVAVTGHFTRVRLYRIFVSKVRKGG